MTTKIELTQVNARLATENTELRAKLSEAVATIERLTELLNTQQPRYQVAPLSTLSYAERMNLAREEALRTGRAVRV